MAFWYIPVGGSGGSGGGGGTPTSANVELHDELTTQIDGVRDTFTVTRGSYTAGTLDLTIGGVGGMARGIHFFEDDPVTGTFRTTRALTLADGPLVAQYKY